MSMNKQITAEQLPMYVGKTLTITDDLGRSHTGEFVGEKTFSQGPSIAFKLKREDKWNGIEMWFDYPNEKTKIYVHE